MIVLPRPCSFLIAPSRNVSPPPQSGARNSGSRKNGAPGAKWGAADTTELGTDYASKLLHLAWHPEANVIAAAASNSLYMYCG